MGLWDTWHPKIKQNEMGSDSVGTDQIIDLDVKPEDVASAIIKARMLENFLTRRQVFYDDFMGASLDLTRWAVSGAPGFSNALNSSALWLLPKNVNGSMARVNWNNNRIFALSLLPIMMVKVADNSVGTRTWLFAFYKDATHYIGFSYDTSVDNKFKAVCSDGGSSTVVDTGIVVASHTNYILTIEGTVSPNKITFSIGDVVVAEITTNIPTASFQPWLEVKTLANSAYGAIIDKTLLIQNKSDINPP